MKGRNKESDVRETTEQILSSLPSRDVSSFAVTLAFLPFSLLPFRLLSLSSDGIPAAVAPSLRRMPLSVSLAVETLAFPTRTHRRTHMDRVNERQTVRLFCKERKEGDNFGVISRLSCREAEGQGRREACGVSGRQRDKGLTLSPSKGF